MAIPNLDEHRSELQRRQLSPKIARYEPVLQAELVEPQIRHALGAQAGDFVDHSVGQALPQPSFDLLPQDVTGPGQPKLQATVSRRALVRRRVRVTGVAISMARMSRRGLFRSMRPGCVRGRLFQARDQLVKGQGFEFRAQWGLGGTSTS
jgi:hypothetical protein